MTLKSGTPLVEIPIELARLFVFSDGHYGMILTDL